METEMEISLTFFCVVFKSHYVVWKLWKQKAKIKTQFDGLNRTMQYGNKLRGKVKNGDRV